MTEALTNDLSHSRQEVLSLRREMENRQYLVRQQQHPGGTPLQPPSLANTITSDYSTDSGSSPVMESKAHRNTHQKARCEKVPTHVLWVMGIWDDQDSIRIIRVLWENGHK